MEVLFSSRCKHELLSLSLKRLKTPPSMGGVENPSWILFTSASLAYIALSLVGYSPPLDIALWNPERVLLPPFSRLPVSYPISAKRGPLSRPRHTVFSLPLEDKEMKFPPGFKRVKRPRSRIRFPATGPVTRTSKRQRARPFRPPGALERYPTAKGIPGERGRATVSLSGASSGQRQRGIRPSPAPEETCVAAGLLATDQFW